MIYGDADSYLWWMGDRVWGLYIKGIPVFRSNNNSNAYIRRGMETNLHGDHTQVLLELTNIFFTK